MQPVKMRYLGTKELPVGEGNYRYLLKPGINDVPHEIYNFWRNQPVFSKLIKDKSLILGTGTLELPPMEPEKELETTIPSMVEQNQESGGVVNEPVIAGSPEGKEAIISLQENQTIEVNLDNSNPDLQPKDTTSTVNSESTDESEKDDEKEKNQTGNKKSGQKKKQGGKTNK